jgi:hypothetical protein
MKICFLGSTSYQPQMNEMKAKLEAEGHEVKIPAFDRWVGLDEMGVCEYNRSIIEWAEMIYVWWDNRSAGFLFDFGMLFYARKAIKIIYLEKKTFGNLLQKYEENRLP